jgi:hypothetical protein
MYGCRQSKAPQQPPPPAATAHGVLQDRNASFLVFSLGAMLDCVAPHTRELLFQLVSSSALATMVNALVCMQNTLGCLEMLKQQVLTHPTCACNNAASQHGYIIGTCGWQLQGAHSLTACSERMRWCFDVSRHAQLLYCRHTPRHDVFVADCMCRQHVPECQ